MISATEKIIWLVEESCIVSPLSTQRMASACGSSISSRGTSRGPTGQKVSGDLPRVHCPSPNCRSRALTSLTQM